jgi:hypothetical protein
MIHVDSNEDKLPWCRAGEEYERAFVEIWNAHYHDKMSINPAKANNPYSADLMWHGAPADLKTQTTPFFTASRYGVDPRFAVVLNRKDVERYEYQYPGMPIFFWVDWQETQWRVIDSERVSPYGPPPTGDTVVLRRVAYFGGIFATNVDHILHLVRSGAPEHSYRARGDDRQGNAKSSYVLDLGTFTRIAASEDPNWWGAAPRGVVDR